MDFDSLLNQGEYFSNYYFAEELPGKVRKTRGAEWNDQDKNSDAGPSPRRRLLGLRGDYHEFRTALADATDRAPVLADWHDKVLRALGYAEGTRGTTDLTVAGEDYEVPFAYQSKRVVAIECDNIDLAADCADPDQIHALDGAFPFATASKLVPWITDSEEFGGVKYVLLLCGASVVIADTDTWLEGKYLAVSVGTVVERDHIGEAELAAALVCADQLDPDVATTAAEAGLAELRQDSFTKAQGVSQSLRDGLRRGVEEIAQEILHRLDEQGVRWDEYYGDDEFARMLSIQSLRYLYRIVFVLFAEARPELDVLPVNSTEYQEGYSLSRLAELVERPLPDAAEDGTYLFDSLQILFDCLNAGFHHDEFAEAMEAARERRDSGDKELAEVEDRNLVVGDWRVVFEPLQSQLFDPKSTSLIGRGLKPEEDLDWEADTRLRNACLHRVLRMLMIDDGTGGRSGRGPRKTQFISYATLGINQLGAVYEGLMSYTGRIAREETLYEVANAKDLKDNRGFPKEGSWLVPADRIDDYDDSVKVTRIDPRTGESYPVTYEDGSFVYRLAGRDRETSASYYTPESLTRVTVQLTLDQWIEENGGEENVKAVDLLKLKVLEPALGSGAFANEAINQISQRYFDMYAKETGKRPEPGNADTELRKIKAHVALHNVYGVDLNNTATELAEISIWLNVMHPGLRAPWFGLHLRRGNSLIGARREFLKVADFDKKKAGQPWYSITPEAKSFKEVPPRTINEAINEQGQRKSFNVTDDLLIHHFLLPSAGWASIAGDKVGKELQPEDAKRLAAWKRNLLKQPTKTQQKRLVRAARQVELLWKFVLERLRLSEEAVERPIDIFGADPIQGGSVLSRKAKQEIVAELERPGGPYWRLKLLMDTWCALWFWPLGETWKLDGEAAPADTPDDFRALTSLDDWLDFVEAIVGKHEIELLASSFENLNDIRDAENQTNAWIQARDELELSSTGQWVLLDQIKKISDDQGFFHWELTFAHVFEQGGFHLQLGNPPWHQPTWEEKAILSEFDPLFTVGSWSSKLKKERKIALLNASKSRAYIESEAAAQSGLTWFLSHITTYPLIAGTRSNLYRNFMVRSWGNSSPTGSIGLIHYDTHLTGEKEAKIREAAYPRLRMHVHFVNERYLFADIGNTKEFSINVSSFARPVRFKHLSWLYEPHVAVASLDDSGSSEITPRIKHRGKWDLRPHSSRVVDVDEKRLRDWNDLVGGAESNPLRAKILYPLTSRELGPIEQFRLAPKRIRDLHPRISSGFDETGVQNAGYFESIDRATGIDDKVAAKQVGDWDEVILQGPHLSIANPFAKAPRTPLVSHKAWDANDLTALPADAVPLTNFRRTVGRDKYVGKQDKWLDENGKRRPYTDFYRVAWREMIPFNSERSLYAVIIPPGVTHVHAVHSAYMGNIRTTVISAGVWMALAMDYFLRISGTGHLGSGRVPNLPAIAENHELSAELLIRTLRLNCLTNSYAPLWEELYDPEAFSSAEWAFPWPGLDRLENVSSDWSYKTPLRTDYARRAALIEIDVIVAIMLGIGVEDLNAIYQARFPVLSYREESMWFDGDGSSIMSDTLEAGFKQANHMDRAGKLNKKQPYEQLFQYLANPESNEPPTGFPRFTESHGLAYYRANRTGMPVTSDYPDGVNGNREADVAGEYATAYAEFKRRMEAGEV
ncbi:class I SAM-dependent DNA methyltransferase [Glycomyces tenuis]|uniref:class I SAM-dependent DNA methyltransferase n=1 Tax=Glycomyces tenuis TaxID=58116 RepID=UPI000423D373|nr:class I SAM-dependent DNA methyltransferase [Glycomyces tenuis]